MSVSHSLFFAAFTTSDIVRRDMSKIPLTQPTHRGRLARRAWPLAAQRDYCSAAAVGVERRDGKRPCHYLVLNKQSTLRKHTNKRATRAT
jgi:hypothetical protein